MHVVLLDIDGTLVDSNGFDTRLYVETMKAILGIDIDANWARYRHVTDSGILEELLDEMGFEGDRDALRVAVESEFLARVDAYLDSRGRVLAEIPGARRFIETLSACPGISIGFATGAWRGSAQRKLRAIGLRPESFVLATGSDAISRPDIMALAARRLAGKKPVTRRTYFGDAVWDKEASAKLGFEFVAIGGNVAHAVGFADYRAPDDILARLSIGRAGARPRTMGLARRRLEKGWQD